MRRPRTDRGTVHDPREGYTVAGVSNRDARAVYDVRVRAMRELWADGQADERALNQLGLLFLDALRLELWEARRLTGFAAFAEEVIGVQVGRAEALAEAASARTGESATPLTERSIALWLRTEAGLYEGDENARARIRTTDAGLLLEITVALSESSTALAGVGARHLPLARSRDERDEREERPRARDDRRDDRREERRRPSREEPRAPSFDAEEELEELLAEESGAEPHEEGFAELAEETGIAEDDDADAPALEADDEEDEPVPSAPTGGVKLLTRKHARDDAAGDERLREERARPERSQFGQRDERPRFQQDRGRFQDRPRAGGNDRPRFNDRNERPRFNDRNDRPRFNDRNERPRFNDRAQGHDRPRFGAGNERPRFNDRGQGGNDRPRFGGGGNDRPRFGGGGNDRPRSNDRGGRGPVDRSHGKPGGKGNFGGPKSFGGAKKFGGPKGKFGGKPQAKGFGARQSFGQAPQNRKRDDDFEE